jgi:hypothetical protein
MAASPQELAAKRQANIANDAARCSLAAQGVKLPGRIAPSTPEAAAACANGAKNMEFRALQLLPAGTQITCSASGGQLSKVEKAVLFDYLHAKAKAEKKDKPVPMPSEEILRLLACG